jgi:amino acid permease
MRREQKTVAVGAATGVIVMIAMLVALSAAIPGLTVAANAGERLAFAAKWIALAATPLFIAIIAVGNARALSDAIDPLAGKESRAMIINGRVVDNTVQQFALFASASLAVAAVSRGDQLSFIAAAAIAFVLARLAFWIGYRIDPLHRAAGFASTAYLNVILFACALWRAWA